MNRKNKRYISLRGKLLIAFLLFAALTVVLLWVFHTFLIDGIYRSLKSSEISSCEQYVLNNIGDDTGDENIKTVTSFASKKYGVCISAYRLIYEGGRKTGYHICDQHINSFCYIHNMSDDDVLNSLYRKTSAAGGRYSEEISISAMFGTRGNDEEGQNYILSVTVPGDGAEYFLIFNTELLPLSSTVSAIRIILIIITVILVIAAVLIAIPTSSMLTKTISDMSDEASKMESGDYNVRFDGGKCSDTVNLSNTLNRAAYQISKLDTMQKDLIANVSHDLRTPLTMIRGYAEVMRDIPGEANEENLGTIIDETENMSSLVNDMLEYSKYHGTDMKPEITSFNISECIRETVARFSEITERDGFSISFRSAGDRIVSGDRDKIERVLYNLISNAINYSGESREIEIRQTDLTDARVKIEVEDHGIGIKKEDLPLIWDRYYKVDGYHSRDKSSSGLGLSIVKSILSMHNLEFGVMSEPGKGSIFWFIIDNAGEDGQI